MLAWLIYDENNIARNKTGFIDRWFAACKEKGIEMEIHTTKEISFGVQDYVRFVAVNRKIVTVMPYFVVMRTMHPLLSKHLEEMGIKVFNNSRVSEYCNDKQKTHELLCGKVPMMDSAFVDARFSGCPFDYPVVVKPSHGCGGLHVELVHNDAEYEKALSDIAPDTALVQRVCDTPGRDLRVYMLGNQILQPMLRYSNGDFRSNFGLGGGAEKYTLNAEETRMVHSISSMFDFGFVGVDFIFHKGRAVFNEIEDAVGSRMLYIYTDHDPVREYLDFILDRI